MTAARSTRWRAVVLLWLVSAGMVGLNLVLEHRHTAQNAREQLLRQAQLLDVQLARQLRAAAAALDLIREDLPGLAKGGDGDQRVGLRLKALARTIAGAPTLIHLDTSGRAVHSNREELVGQDFSSRQYFQAARAANQDTVLLISPPFKTVLGVNAFNVSYALQDARGAFAGVITATLEGEFHQTLLDAARFAPGVWAALVHGGGRLISISPPDPATSGRDLAVPGSMFLRHRESGAAESHMEGKSLYSGVPTVLVQRTVKVPDLQVDPAPEMAVAQDTTSLFAGWRGKAYTQAIGLVLLFAASGLVFATWAQRGRAAEALEAERAAAEAKSHEELVKAREFLQVTLDAIPVAVFVKDVSSKLLFVNRSAERLWSMPAAALLGTDTSGLAPADQMEVHLATDRVVIESKAPGDWIRTLWNTELQQNRMVHSYKTPLLDDHGDVKYIVGTHIDVTEQLQSHERVQQALRDKEALLREVHHRVKNNLQVFSSLLRLEGGRINHPASHAMLQEMQGRIRSMAILHEMLYRTESFASINLASYVESLSVQSARSHGGAGAFEVQLALKLEPVEVGIDQATPCGLLVFELLSNAYKHAFSDGRSGTLLVELHPAPTPQRWILRVSDDGTGLPADFAQRQAQSLGLQLVSDLSRQMGGNLVVGGGDTGGAIFTVEFPVQPAAGSVA